MNEEKKKNKKIWVVLIVLLLIIFCFVYLFVNMNNDKKNEKKKEENKKTTTKAKTNDNWYIPNGTENKINVYISLLDGYPNIIKDDEDSYFKSSNEYKILNSYLCTSKTCKGYGISQNSGEVIIYDNGYVIYDYNKNRAMKLKIPNALYNSVEFLSYEGKKYGLAVSNINNLYAFYSFEKEEFTTEFKYTNIFSFEEAGLADGNISVAIAEDGNYEVSKYYIVSYDTGEVKKESNAYLGSFGNKNHVYYYENFSEMDGYEAIIYNDSFKKVLDEELYQLFAVTSSGNLIVKNKDENTFSIYTKNGKLIKKSKEYKEIGVVSNDYISVIDTDDYLKIVNIDGNVAAKFIKMTDNYIFHTMLSGWYKQNGKDGIYLVLENTDIEYGNKGSGLEYYYIPKTKEKGVIETIGVGGYAKPVLYLYPKENNTYVTINFEKEKLLTTTYPKYNNGWSVVANKNGDLHDLNGKYYYGLYWEESGYNKVDFKTGFYVTSDNAIDFLEEKLKLIGLNERESNEFIMYWLPILEKNQKNLVYFELTEERDSYNKININPKPDSLLRIAMHVKKVNKKINIKEQNLSTFERKGFTAVEWGGVLY